MALKQLRLAFLKYIRQDKQNKQNFYMHFFSKLAQYSAKLRNVKVVFKPPKSPFPFDTLHLHENNDHYVPSLYSTV